MAGLASGMDCKLWSSTERGAHNCRDVSRTVRYLSSKDSAAGHRELGMASLLCMTGCDMGSIRCTRCLPGTASGSQITPEAKLTEQKMRNA